MQALGLIETRGLVGAIESADAMLKAADVTLIEKTYVGGGLVSIAVTGEVSSVKAAVDAGTAAVRQINHSLLMFYHVIPRPSDELDDLIFSVKSQTEQPFGPINLEPEEQKMMGNPLEKENGHDFLKINEDEINKTAIDQVVVEFGLEKALQLLTKLKVTKLRNLARDYKDFGITGRVISKANKKTMLTEFENYYINQK
jgi:ethanolamine utilization protein EutM